VRQRPARAAAFEIAIAMTELERQSGVKTECDSDALVHVFQRAIGRAEPAPDRRLEPAQAKQELVNRKSRFQTLGHRSPASTKSLYRQALERAAFAFYLYATEQGGAAPKKSKKSGGRRIHGAGFAVMPSS
jgi:hypothetical protein